MNQMVSTADLERDVVVSLNAMTRAEKLQRWADLIRKHQDIFRLYHRLEHCSQQQLDSTLADADGSAFEVATRDPILRDAGLIGMTGPVTIGKLMNFFELSKDELHEFSCDCGGSISNAEMADRVEKIARGESKNAAVARVREWLRF